LADSEAAVHPQRPRKHWNLSGRNAGIFAGLPWFFQFWARDERVHELASDIGRWYITKGDGDADRPN